MSRHDSDGGRRPGESLRAADVSRSFEGVKALQGVTLELARDEVIGLIGPNGAGKTTLINLITGFDLPTSGSIALGSHDVTRWSARKRARAGLARTFQHGHLFGDLTVRENIELAALGVGMKARAARSLCSDLLDALGLREREQTRASSLSHGDAQKVGVARALGSRPRFMLMDEPAAGLSEVDLQAFSALVRRMRSEYEAGVVMVDHNVALIMDVCDHVYVLDQGRMLAHGPPSEIRQNLDVSAAYLGSNPIEGDAGRG